MIFQMLPNGVRLPIFASLLSVLAFLIPFNSFAIQYGIILLVLLWLFIGGWHRNLGSILRQPLALTGLFFYFLHLLSMFFSENLPEGWNQLERKTSFLVFPLLLGFRSRISVEAFSFRISILLSFVVGCFFSTIICLIRAALQYAEGKGTVVFLYHELGSYFGLHAVYYSIYLIIAVAILLSYVGLNGVVRSRFQVGLAITGVLYFTLILVLLSSRIVLVGYGVFIFTLGVALIWQKRAYRTGLGLIVILLAVTFFLVRSNHFFKQRLMEILQSKLYFDPKENNANGLTLRLVKWSCSWKGILEHPVTGVGIGDMQEYLQECYNERNFWGRVFRYNSHNQFLQTGLGLGLPGVAVLAAFLLFCARHAWQHHDFVLGSAIGIYLMTFLTESILERQQGVIPFVFFALLLTVTRPVDSDSQPRPE